MTLATVTAVSVAPYATSGQVEPHPSFHRAVRSLPVPAVPRVRRDGGSVHEFAREHRPSRPRRHAPRRRSRSRRRQAGDRRRVAPALARARDLVDANLKEIAVRLWPMVERTDAIFEFGGSERLAEDSARSASAKASAIVYEMLARHGIARSRTGVTRRESSKRRSGRWFRTRVSLVTTRAASCGRVDCTGQWRRIRVHSHHPLP